jgi:hypothetical protein
MIYRLRNLLLFGIAACFVLCSAVFAERLSLYGFALPYPKQLPELINQEAFPPVLEEKHFQVQFVIDKSGKVKSVQAINPVDSAFVRVIKKSSAEFLFEPALNGGKAVECNLLVAVQILAGNFRVVFTPPLDAQQVVTNTALYFTSMERNGIGLPSLVSFPSYWSNLSVKDSVDIPKFILLEVQLNKTEQIEDVRIVRSTYPAFESQIVSAATRARINLPTVKGKPIAASVFLSVLFFPGNNYPTAPFSPESASSLPLRERVQLRCIADTVGLLSGPVPKFNPAESVVGASYIERNKDTIAVYLAVSPSGAGGCLRHDEIPAKLSEWIRAKATWMKFYPALDFSGNPQPFAGATYFIFSDSTSIRIDYTWF